MPLRQLNSTDNLIEDHSLSIPTPTGDSHSEEEHHKLVRLDDVAKLKMTMVAVIGFPLIIYIFHFVLKCGVGRTVAVLTACSHIIYFATLYSHMFNAKYLYRVQPRYTVLKHWAQMSIPYHLDQYINHPIMSISEFSSIRGTFTNLLLF
eukprot:453553_1